MKKLYRKIFLLLLLPVILSVGFSQLPDSWEVNPAEFEFFMPIISVIEINEILSESDNYILGAFTNGECRGVAQPIYIFNQWIYYLMVYGDTNNETLEFKVYNTTTEVVSIVNETLTFQAGVAVGMTDAPIVLHAQDGDLIFPAVCPTFEYDAGDVNQDNSVDVLDIVKIIFIILELIEFDDLALCTSDYNQDGEVNIQDVILIANQIVDSY